MHAIEVRDCTKTYKRGKVTALKEVSLTVPEGSFTGLLGPNGAGKTTLIHLLASILCLDEGELRIFDQRVDGHSCAYKRAVGFIFEQPCFIERLTGREYLELAARLYEVSFSRPLIPEKGWNTLKEALNRWIESYSHGMRKQLAFLTATLHRPPLLIFDEPFEGLDLEAIAEVQETLQQYREEEKSSLLISSHQLHRLLHLCDRMVVINKGQKVFEGHTEALLQAIQPSSTDALELERAYLNWLHGQPNNGPITV